MMRDVDDCPGAGKCHGPVNWCDVCGDVDLVCDDPACDQHSREEELRDRAIEAAWAVDEARRKLRETTKDHLEALYEWSHYLAGRARMIPRTVDRLPHPSRGG